MNDKIWVEEGDGSAKANSRPQDGHRPVSLSGPPPSSNIVQLANHRFMEALYRSCWNELCGWLHRRFGPGPPEPEDVAQLAFRKIAEMEDVSVIVDPRAFLYTVAARTAVSGLRSRYRAQAFVDSEMRENALEVEEITPDRVYTGKERLRIVELGLAKLSEMQREIVFRNRVLGQTYAQISEDTGWSLASISRHLQAALISISQELATEDKSEANQ